MKVYPFEFLLKLDEWHRRRFERKHGWKMAHLHDSSWSYLLVAFAAQVILGVWCLLLVTLGLWKP